MRYDEPGLDTYLEEIERYRLLTREEEVELARRIARGDQEARHEMIRANLRLVVHVAMQYASRHVSLLDLIAEGNIGLMKAVERFDPDRHIRFSTYATWWIRQYVRRALQTCGPTVRVPGYMVELISRWKRAREELTEKLGRDPTANEVSKHMNLSPERMQMIRRALSASSTTGPAPETAWLLEGALADTSTPAPEDQILKESEYELLQHCASALTDREWDVLRLRYGLDTGRPMTLEKIGERIGLTRERVRQIESEALRKLSEAYRERSGAVEPPARRGR